MVLLLAACQGETAVTPTDTSLPTDTSPPTDSTPTGDDTGEAPPPITLCVNEFMPDNESSAEDDTNRHSDWIELHNFGDEPVSLAGWGVTDDRADPWRHELSAALEMEPGDFLLLWASGEPDYGDDHLPFELSADGGDVGLYSPDGRGQVVAYGTVADDFAVARVTDCCTGDGCFEFQFHGTPGISNVPVVTEKEKLLSAGSTWRYYDAGTLPGQGWYEPTFDDAAWASGPGPLGYGDTHLATTVSYGGDDANKHTTTWFRASFEASDLGEVVSAEIALLRDDGAVVYLNGVEVVRDNMPEGTVDATTFASSSTGSSDETAYWEFEFDPSTIVEGTNVLAVEVHQHSLDSSDLGFDLRLSVERVVSE
ncbi:MAG: lamin tail domain-containing protein [Myxococcota bacterium]